MVSIEDINWCYNEIAQFIARHCNYVWVCAAMFIKMRLITINKRWSNT